MSPLKFFLSLLLVCLAGPALGFDAGGELLGSTLWQGEVQLRQAVVVPAGVTLIIDAGTRVQAASADAGLVVRGTLLVNGLAEAPVVFATSPDWSGIELTESAVNSSIDHAEFTHAHIALSSVSGSFILRHCQFRHNQTALKLLRGSAPQVEENRFSGNGIGIDSEMKAAPSIRNNQFRNNTEAGIVLSHNSVGPIEGNLFEGNNKGISVLQQYDDQISGNRFNDNEIAIYCNQTQESPRILGNRFTGNRLALANVSFAAPRVRDNSFIGNEVAIRNDQHGSALIANNLFRDNGTAIYNYRKSNPLIEKNLIEGNTIALYCDFSSYPQVRHNNFGNNKLSVKLGIYQSGDWERQFGANNPIPSKMQAGKARKLQPVLASSEVPDSVDVRQNWWGDDTDTLAAAGQEANLEMFYDGHDQPRVYYDGFAAEGYVFDLVSYTPWLAEPVADCGPH